MPGEVHAVVPDPELAAALERAGIRDAPESGPLRPTDIVECVLGARILAKVCTRRSTWVWPSGGGAGAPMLPECANCRTGAEIRSRLLASGYEPPPSTLPAETLPPAQRRARARWRLEHVEEPLALEPGPSREAAELTPDDRSLP